MVNAPDTVDYRTWTLLFSRKIIQYQQEIEIVDSPSLMPLTPSTIDHGLLTFSQGYILLKKDRSESTIT